MKSLILFAVLFCSLAGTAFAREQGSAAHDADKRQTKKSVQAEQIEVPVGKTFNVTLDSNPTTGYRWQLAKPLDEAILKLVGSEYKKPATKLVGAGGKEVWVFKAVAKGQASIQMKYVRPWEKDVGPVKKATFTVIAR